MLVSFQDTSWKETLQAYLQLETHITAGKLVRFLIKLFFFLTEQPRVVRPWQVLFGLVRCLRRVECQSEPHKPLWSKFYFKAHADMVETGNKYIF
jgi:hypothetical protein